MTATTIAEAPRRPRSRDEKLIAVLAKHGIVEPKRVLKIARASKLKIREAATLLEKESSGGHNVFGHDGVRPPQIKGGPVTKARYRRYKALRRICGAQGVGPTQLTYPPTQDIADKRGGCWKPDVNMRVGFEHLAELIAAHGRHEGFRQYNGGPSWNAASERYADDAVRRVEVWERRFRDAGVM